MTIIPADSYSGNLDLLLADGSIIYRDGAGRWFIVAPDGSERFVGICAALKPEPGDGAFSQPASAFN